MRSCAKGHYDTAMLLCKWNSNALEVKNYRKQNPVAVAIENGYVSHLFLRNIVPNPSAMMNEN